MWSWHSFESCYAALLAELWAEMEAMLALKHTEGAERAGLPERSGAVIDALLDEFALLWDKCEFLEWRGLLASRHAEDMRGLLAELGALFDSARPHVGAAIVRAQNRVFDEVQRIAREQDSIAVMRPQTSMLRGRSPSYAPEMATVPQMS
jgi:hypothetical protein